MNKSRLLLASVMAAATLSSSLASSFAFAQPPHDNPGHGGDHGHGPGPGHADHDKGPNGHGHKSMPPGHGPDGPGHSANAPGHWRKGDRLPPEYRDRQYVIDDWRAYRLAPPPRGYSWVGIGGDYLMVQLSTGVILRVGP
ncbi:RcnB family protein [Paraburkholderia phenoliruptrix]|uniref:RcnB family protein n=1 Tax=Paraburkholderia phenoliruptrix TaxID=252970 RepID=UPI002869DDA3|nr:RcnB family protein [Paraburkholderia phenoliruptrix]WMY10837.1 RcnB family protein [Paraburkholderia phenoliruptrix]